MEMICLGIPDFLVHGKDDALPPGALPAELKNP